VTKTINPKFLKIDDIRIFKNHCMKHVKDVQENKVFVDKFSFPAALEYFLSTAFFLFYSRIQSVLK